MRIEWLGYQQNPFPPTGEVICGGIYFGVPGHYGPVEIKPSEAPDFRVTGGGITISSAGIMCSDCGREAGDPCHSRPQSEWCDHDGIGGFMGHTCGGATKPEPPCGGKPGGEWHDSAEEIRKVIEVAHKHGWNGVENSKILWQFIDDMLTDLENKSEGQRGVIESQKQALAEWRRKADADAGRLVRYRTALEEIAHTPWYAKECAALEAFEQLRVRAQRELEGTVVRP
jgi:hypothetical protein